MRYQMELSTFSLRTHSEKVFPHEFVYDVVQSSEHVNEQNVQ